MAEELQRTRREQTDKNENILLWLKKGIYCTDIAPKIYVAALLCLMAGCIGFFNCPFIQ